MRAEGRGEHDSLYFDYPSFPPPRDRSRLADPTPVIIAGAGPVGMCAALTLARHGIASVLIDRKDTFNDGSRAICISRSSFYILEALGAAAPFLEKSLGWTTGRTFYRGRQILEFHMPDGADEKFRPMYNLEQQYIEAFLHDAVQAEPLIDIRWQTEVTDLSQTGDGVTLGLRDPNGDYRLPGQWLLAADGARSTIRKLRGLRLKGENYEGRYVIADVQMDHDYPTIRRALFDPACRPGGTVLVHRQPDNIWRIDYQLRDDEENDTATREAEIRRNVEALLDEVGHTGGYDLEWWSVYSANTLALDDYRDGRIFFVGDSAHIVPIFGVRGLNNGLADAQNIGWKLAWVMQGRADPALLDSYTPERRGATLDVFANASKSTRFMTPPSHGWQLMRDAALSLALSQPFAGALANPRQMAPYTYAESPVTTPDADGFAAGPMPGAVCADPPLESGHLSDRFKGGFTILSFGKTADFAPLTSPDIDWIALPGSGPVAEAFGATDGTVYLVRPDIHIAGRWRSATTRTLSAALARALGRTGIAA